MTNEQLVAKIQSNLDVSENMLQLWNQNKNFIFQMAMKYRAYAEHEDLMQEGYMGLNEAVKHYKPEQGSMFLSYAAFWIQQRMVRYIENCCKVVRIPSYSYQSLKQYKRTYSMFMQMQGREPTDQELCGLMCIGYSKLQELRKLSVSSKVRSLSEPIGGEDEDVILGDTVATEQELDEDIIRKLDTEAMCNELWEMVDKLPKDQSEVIRIRYLDNKTRKATSEELGITENDVKKLESKAFRELRLTKNSNKVKKYYEQYIAAANVRHVGLSTYLRTWTSAVELELFGWPK